MDVQGLKVNNERSHLTPAQTIQLIAMKHNLQATQAFLPEDKSCLDQDIMSGHILFMYSFPTPGRDVDSSNPRSETGNVLPQTFSVLSEWAPRKRGDSSSRCLPGRLGEGWVYVNTLKVKSLTKFDMSGYQCTSDESCVASTATSGTPERVTCTSADWQHHFTITTRGLKIVRDVEVGIHF